MKVLAVVSRLAGSGKSMLAAHLSVHADRLKPPAVLVDATSKGSLASWRELRRGKTPILLKCEGKEIADTLEAVRRDGVEWAVLDTDASTEADAVRVAHLLIVPFRPSDSFLSLLAVSGVMNMARDVGKTTLTVINAAPPHGADNSEHLSVAAARRGLTRLGVTAWPWQITQRAAFADALALGKTVSELEPHGPAAREIAALWETVKLYLAKRESAPLQ